MSYVCAISVSYCRADCGLKPCNFEMTSECDGTNLKLQDFCDGEMENNHNLLKVWKEY